MKRNLREDNVEYREDRCIWKDAGLGRGDPAVLNIRNGILPSGFVYIINGCIVLVC